jgi:hypothetical protein
MIIILIIFWNYLRKMYDPSFNKYIDFYEFYRNSTNFIYFLIFVIKFTLNLIFYINI